MTVDLTRFCCVSEDNRPNLCKPFSRGEYTYATNGHIAVRVPRVAEWPEVPAAPAIELLAFPDAATTFMPAPKIELPKVPDVAGARCGGSRREHDCPQCKCACTRCRGTGVSLDCCSVGFGASIIDARYFLLIEKLPKLELGPPAGNEPMPFRFDGGDGLIMPRSREALHHVNADARKPHHEKT